MLLKLATLWGTDNSGCSSAKLIQLFSNQICHSGELVKVVMKRFDKRRKLQPKKKYLVIPISLTQMMQRRRGDMYKFNINRIIMLTDNMKRLLGTRIYGPSIKEVRKIPLERSILQKIVSYAYYTI